MILILFLEVVVSFIIAILLLCALLYYSSTFVEERMTSFTKFLKYFNVVILSLSLLLPLSNFPLSIFGLVFFNNLMWTLLLFRGFPLTNYVRPEFFLGFITTVFSHLFLTLFFLKSPSKSLLTTISYFILYVWLIPIMIIISLSAVEETSNVQTSNTQETTPKPKTQSFIKKFFDRMLRKAEDILPHAGDKFDFFFFLFISTILYLYFFF